MTTARLYVLKVPHLFYDPSRPAASELMERDEILLEQRARAIMDDLDREELESAPSGIILPYTANNPGEDKGVRMLQRVTRADILHEAVPEGFTTEDVGQVRRWAGQVDPRFGLNIDHRERIYRLLDDHIVGFVPTNNQNNFSDIVRRLTEATPSADEEVIVIDGDLYSNMPMRIVGMYAGEHSGWLHRE